MQVSRRNLTPMQLSHFRGIHYQAETGILSDLHLVPRKAERTALKKR